MRLRNFRRSVHMKATPEEVQVSALRMVATTEWYIDHWNSEVGPPAQSIRVGDGLGGFLSTSGAKMVYNPDNGRITLAGTNYVIYSDDDGATWSRGTMSLNIGVQNTPASRIIYVPGTGYFVSNGLGSSSARVSFSKDGVRWNYISTLVDVAMLGIAGGRLCLWAYNANNYKSATLASIVALWEAASASQHLAVVFDTQTTALQYIYSAIINDEKSFAFRQVTSNPAFIMTEDGVTLNVSTATGATGALGYRDHVYHDGLGCLVLLNTSNTTVRLKTLTGNVDSPLNDPVSVPGFNLSFTPQAIAKSGNKLAVLGTGFIAFGAGEITGPEERRFTFVNYGNGLAGTYLSAFSKVA